MSRSGCPYDNAPMERFYNTFKNELIYQNIYYSPETLDEAVNHYVFLWYNHVRPHSYNGGLTPFEARNRWEKSFLSVAILLDHYTLHRAL